MKAEVINTQGNSTGRQVELADAIFGIVPNDHVIYLAVKQYLANKRQGTHKAKERSEMSGSTRKLHKQKGTGGSRKGDINNPLYKGGGRVFGPRVRDYDLKLNKKVSVLARKSALSSQMKDGNVIVVENFNFDAPKTKSMNEVLKNLSLTGNKVLLVTGEISENVVLSARNLPQVHITEARNLNTYQILNAGKIVLFENSIDPINQTLS